MTPPALPAGAGRVPVAPATLTSALRAFDDDRLAALLIARPDLVLPIPADLVGLADRACTRASLARILDRLDRPHLAVMESLTLLERPATASTAHRSAGLDDPEGAAVLGRLRALGLVWGSDDDLIVPAASLSLLRSPGGLGPSAADLLDSYSPRRLARLAADLGVAHVDETELATGRRDVLERARRLVTTITLELRRPDRVAALLADAGPEAEAAARRLAEGNPAGRLSETDLEPTRSSARTPVEALLARGLVVATDPHVVVLPREVGWVVRGERLVTDPSAVAAPSLDGTARDPDLVDRAAAGTTLEVLARIEHLLHLWGENPPTVLRAGGLGVRELRRTAAALGVDDDEAALLVEVAGATGLVAESDDNDPVWLPTPEADRWRAEPLADRWVALAAGWIASTRTPSLVGSRDERGKSRAALSIDTDRSATPDIRRTVLGILADLPPGRCPSTDAVLAYLGWLRPRRMATDAARAVAGAVIGEAGRLGLIGLGGLCRPARALLAGGDAAAVLAGLLPEPSDQVLLQADLTAVAPGPLEPALARAMASMAEVESRGSATVYRFTPTSVRRALDAGMTASGLMALLHDHSQTPVPQPLEYLVSDVARRHGTVRAGQAGAYLRGENVEEMRALLADSRLQGLALRLIADTVLLSPQPLDIVLDTLREAGLSPVAEGSDGAVLTSTAHEPRRAGRMPGGSAPMFALPTGDVGAAVRSLRAGERARAARPAGAPTGLAVRSVVPAFVETLALAIRDRAPVWLGYLDRQGGAHDRVVTPVRIEAGRLSAYDADREAAADFALHRITGVTRLATPPG